MGMVGLVIVGDGGEGGQIKIANVQEVGKVQVLYGTHGIHLLCFGPLQRVVSRGLIHIQWTLAVVEGPRVAKCTRGRCTLGSAHAKLSDVCERQRCDDTQKAEGQRTRILTCMGGKNERWTVKPRKNMYQGSGRLAAEKTRMTYLFLPLSTCLSFAGTTLCN